MLCFDRCLREPILAFGFVYLKWSIFPFVWVFTIWMNFLFFFGFLPSIYSYTIGSVDNALIKREIEKSW
jgi:hypothetical protein